MHLFSTTFLDRHQCKLVFGIVWLHVSVLDLFYITYKGPVFLWEDNSQLLTIGVHFSIALVTTVLYKIIVKVSKKKSARLSK